MRKKRRNLWSLLASIAIAGVLALCLSKLPGDWNKYQDAMEIKKKKLTQLESLEEQRDTLRQRSIDLESDSLEKQRLLRSQGYGRPNEQRYVLRTKGEPNQNGSNP